MIAVTAPRKLNVKIKVYVKDGEKDRFKVNDNDMFKDRVKVKVEIRVNDNDMFKDRVEVTLMTRLR